MQERNLNHLAQQYNGKQYYVEKEQDYISCKGCAFNKQDVADGYFCACDDSYMTDYCYNQQIIWKEVKAPVLKKTKDEEPKFPVEQVLLAAGNYLREHPVFQDYDKIYVEALLGITEQLMKQDDPGYKLYLELKSKYES